MGASLKDVQAAIHKSAAGRMSQTTTPAAAPSSVSLDLDVLATQAKDYSTGTAAGAKQAQGNAAANSQLLAEDRAAADASRAQTAEATRQNAVSLELSRQAQAQKAQQNLDATRRDAELNAQKDAAQAELAARKREGDEEALRQEVLNARIESENTRKETVLRGVQRQHGKQHNEVFEYITSRADNMGQANTVIDTLARDGFFGRDAEYNSVRMDIIYKDLEKIYGARR